MSSIPQSLPLADKGILARPSAQKISSTTAPSAMLLLSAQGVHTPSIPDQTALCRMDSVAMLARLVGLRVTNVNSKLSLLNQRTMASA